MTPHRRLAGRRVSRLNMVAPGGTGRPITSRRRLVKVLRQTRGYGGNRRAKRRPGKGGDESVWESNPLGALFTPPAGFEDQGRHQTCKHSPRSRTPADPQKHGTFDHSTTLPRSRQGKPLGDPRATSHAGSPHRSQFEVRLARLRAIVRWLDEPRNQEAALLARALDGRAPTVGRARSECRVSVPRSRGFP